MMFLRRGAIAPTVLVGIVLAVVGFFIVLYFIGQFGFEDFGIDETCKLSVLTRATTPVIGQGFVPLKCTTKKTCLNDGGEDCEQFGKEEGTNVKLRGDAEDKAEVIQKTIADSMYSCWKMMGEGKIDLLGNDFSVLGGDAKSSCVICSRIALGEDFRESGGEDGFEAVAEKVRINDYLEKKKSPSGHTYLQEFTDRSVRAYGDFEDNIEGSGEGKGTSELAVLYSQIVTKDDPWEKALGVGGGAFLAVGGAALTPAGKVFAIPYVGQILAIGALGGIVIAGISAYSGAVSDQAVSLGYCGEFTSNADNRQGCSILTLVDYSDVDQINNFCAGGILGNL